MPYQRHCFCRRWQLAKRTIIGKDVGTKRLQSIPPYIRYLCLIAPLKIQGSSGQGKRNIESIKGTSEEDDFKETSFYEHKRVLHIGTHRYCFSMGKT